MADSPTRPTPAPWKLSYYGPSDEWIRDANGEAIMMIGANDTRNPQNAALIVAACNACQLVNPQNPLAAAKAFGEVVAALRVIVTLVNGEAMGHHWNLDMNSPPMLQARAALASIETQETR